MYKTISILYARLNARESARGEVFIGQSHGGHSILASRRADASPGTRQETERSGVRPDAFGLMLA